MTAHLLSPDATLLSDLIHVTDSPPVVQAAALRGRHQGPRGPTTCASSGGGPSWNPSVHCMHPLCSFTGSSHAGACWPWQGLQEAGRLHTEQGRLAAQDAGREAVRWAALQGGQYYSAATWHRVPPRGQCWHGGPPCLCPAHAPACALLMRTLGAWWDRRSSL
jgi:hypothetical protein